jgi:two-component system, NarL family, response regulator NreC
MGKTRILLADDHDVVRKGLTFLLERINQTEVVGEATDGHQAVELAEKLSPTVVIMDVAMPLLNGIDAASQIVKRRPETSIILLSMHADEDYVIRGLNAGVKGYILKESVERDLPLALEAVSKQRHFFSSTISEVLLADFMRQLRHKHVHDSYDLLTDREKEVLQLIAEGKTNKDAAGLLNVSLQTIESHRANLMQKLGLHSTADIILYAVRKRIIS